MKYSTAEFIKRVHEVFGDQLQEIKLPDDIEENNDVRDFLIMLDKAYAVTKKCIGLNYVIDNLDNQVEVQLKLCA